MVRMNFKIDMYTINYIYLNVYLYVFFSNNHMGIIKN